jgi:hypothetical protein
MDKRNTRLVIEDNTVYELDLACIRRKKRQEMQQKRRQRRRKK